VAFFFERWPAAGLPSTFFPVGRVSGPIVRPSALSAMS
jgi:hypothetical protein